VVAVLRWILGVVLVVLLAANLASTWYTYSKTRDHLDAVSSQTRETVGQASRTVSADVTASGRAAVAKLDRNWRMAIVARKAACDAFYSATTLAHYQFPSECDLANMEPHRYYVRFWRQPYGWNLAN
jgi:hypothetical protein